MPKIKRPSAKLTKAQLADALARALNLLNGLDRDDWSARDLGEFHALAAVLDASPDVRADFANNATLDARDLI